MKYLLINAQNPVEEAMSMAPSQSMYARGSEPSLISGYPSVVEGFEAFADDFDLLFSDVLNKVLDFARDDMRRQARNLPGWKDIADSLEVDFDGDGFVYGATGDAAAQAERLEYGDQTIAPTGFLRKTANAQAHKIGLMMTEALSQEVPSA